VAWPGRAGSGECGTPGRSARIPYPAEVPTPRPLLSVVLLLPACAPEPAVEPAPAVEDWGGAVEGMALDVDLDARTATARLDLAPGPSGAFSLRTDGLSGIAVSSDSPVDWAVAEGRLDLGLVAAPTTVTVDYAFDVAARFEGWMDTGSTVTWPEFCGNLFPCRPHPAEAHATELTVTGDGVVAASIDAPAPAYQVAWAQGDYAELALGTTDGGVSVVAHHWPEDAQRAQEGTADLVAHVSWLEEILGAYPFGTVTGPVEVEWGNGYGGIEHHPRWHVSSIALHDPVVHAHEAVHAWYGDGVRLGCWEDLVLSEGVATYLAARAVGAAGGPDAEAAVWADYEGELGGFFGVGSQLAWIEECGVEDPYDGALRTRAPYIKGALFFRALGEETSPAAVDAALGTFARQAMHEARRMADLLAHLQAELGVDPRPLAEAWLLSTSVPQ
jgi:hypothetical protein